MKRFHKYNNKNRSESNANTRTGSDGVKDGFMRYSKDHYNILPPPSVLESYEEIAPGFVAKLSQMIEAEQKHRHALEARELRTAVSITRFGQLLSVLLGMGIIYATIIATETYGISLGAIICICGFMFLIISNLLAVKIHRRHATQQQYGRNKWNNNTGRKYEQYNNKHHKYRK